MHPLSEPCRNVSFLQPSGTRKSRRHAIGPSSPSQSTAATPSDLLQGRTAQPQEHTSLDYLRVTTEAKSFRFLTDGISSLRKGSTPFQCSG